MSASTPPWKKEWRKQEERSLFLCSIQCNFFKTLFHDIEGILALIFIRKWSITRQASKIQSSRLKKLETRKKKPKPLSILFLLCYGYLSQPDLQCLGMGLGCTAGLDKPQQWGKRRGMSGRKQFQFPRWSCSSAGLAGNANRKQIISWAFAGKWCQLMSVDRAVLSSVSTSLWRKKTKAFQAELPNEGKSQGKFQWEYCQHCYDKCCLNCIALPCAHRELQRLCSHQNTAVTQNWPVVWLIW